MILTNIKIHTMLDSIINSGYIYIQNGKIKDFGPMDNCPEIDDKVIDLPNLNVYPGFIDAHSHLGIFEDGINFEGDDGNEMTDPSTPHLRVIDAINAFDKCFSEALKSGVTTVACSPGSSNPVAGQIAIIKTFGNRIDDMVIKAPAAIKFALGENPKTVYNEKNQSPVTRMATAAIIREQLYKAKAYYKDKREFEADPDNFDAPEYDSKCEALIPLLKREIPAHFHAHRADDIFTAIRIAKEFNLKYAIIHATEGHLISNKLKDENAAVFCGPFLCDRSKPELRNLTPETPGVLSKAKLSPSIVTDHPVIPQQYLSTCAALAVKEGMSELDALKAITVNPAIALGIDKQVGCIRKGSDADLVVYEGNPLDFKLKPYMVICNGNIIN